MGYQDDEKQDFARVDMKKSDLSEPVDQFTITVDKFRPAAESLT